jgi:hypothetical protein
VFGVVKIRFFGVPFDKGGHPGQKSILSYRYRVGGPRVDQERNSRVLGLSEGFPENLVAELILGWSKNVLTVLDFVAKGVHMG